MARRLKYRSGAGPLKSEVYIVTPPDSSDVHSGQACFGQCPASQKDKRGPNLVSDALPSVAFGTLFAVQPFTCSLPRHRRCSSAPVSLDGVNWLLIGVSRCFHSGR